MFWININFMVNLSRTEYSRFWTKFLVLTFDLRAKTINIWFGWKSNSACSENMLKFGISVSPYLCVWHIDRKLLNHKRTLEKNRSKLLENSRVLDSKYVFELTTEHSEIHSINVYSYIFGLPWYLSIWECVPKKGLGKNQAPFCRIVTAS